MPALVAALKDTDVEVRRVAVQSLANYNDPRAIPGLVGALKDSDSEVRVYAAMALGNMGDERALPGLLVALKDSNTDVRRSALSAPQVPHSAAAARSWCAPVNSSGKNIWPNNGRERPRNKKGRYRAAFSYM